MCMTYFQHGITKLISIHFKEFNLKTKIIFDNLNLEAVFFYIILLLSF